MSEATRILSEFCENITYEDIPQEVIDRTKLLLLDTIGIIVRARHDSESTDSLLAGIDKLGLTDGNCSVLATPKIMHPQQRPSLTARWPIRSILMTHMPKLRFMPALQLFQQRLPPRN